MHLCLSRFISKRSFKPVEKGRKGVEMERQSSLRLGALERLHSFMEKQKSFKERKSKDSPGKKGDTSLHLAARAGNLAHVQKILSDQSDETQLRDLVSKQNQDGETALYVSAEKGHVDVVREILTLSDVQSAAVKANNSFDAFHIAAKQGHLEVVKELLHYFPALAMTTNSLNSTAFNTAATQGHTDIVNLLLETDASLARIARNNGKTALHSAARMGHVEVVISILNKDPGIGLRTDKKGQAALHMAVKGQNVDVVLELLKPDVSVIHLEDNKGNKPLHIATRKGNLKMLRALLSVEGIDVNAVNKAGDTALAIAEKCCYEEIAAVLSKVGAVTVKGAVNTPKSPAKQLKQTVSDIKHDVQSQLRQNRQTEMKVKKIKRRLHKLHISGLNNAINSNTVVAVLIATVAFAAIFVVPGQFVPKPSDGSSLPPGVIPGQAYIAGNAFFIIFLIFDSLALFISLAVVIVQTSLIVVEQKAKRMMVFVMNKLMWLACLFISAAFISLTYVVVDDRWLAWSTMAIGTLIMLATIGAMCYCIVVHRMEEKNMRSIQRASASQSRSRSLSGGSDSELLTNEYKKMYAL